MLPARAVRAASLLVTVALLAACGRTPQTAPTASTATSTGVPTASVASPLPSASASSGPLSQTPSMPSTTPRASPSPTPDSCTRMVDALSLAEQVGQLFMVGVPSSGLSEQAADTLGRYHAGSVILLQNSRAGMDAVQRLTDRVRDATDGPKGVRTLLAADQEGGLVQRLRGPGFSEMPSARTQAELSDGQLAERAETWGKQLKRAGIDANLAPVADVVPTSMVAVNQPIGVLRRGYGPDPTVVARKTRAFVRGMNAAGVATAVKHFPGLGRVRGNTDFVTRVVDSSTTRHDGDLAGFASAVEAGVDMVMVSSAYYARIDPDNRAAFSDTVIGGMIRGDLGFTGVVISDDLAAPGLRGTPPGENAMRFLRAGGDLVIVGTADDLPAMATAVRKAAGDDAAFARRVADKAARVLALKARRGLADC